MDFRRRMSWIGVALGVVLAIGVPLTAGAQAPPGAATAEPYTPAKDAKDLKAVLFNWMWHMGMLKGHDERDMVATLEYQGKGTIQVDGQPCTLTKYRASTNYQTFSQRIQYACTRPNGQTYSNIEVVSGLYAWNEDTPGAEIGPTKGKATPMPATVQERLIRIWASPQGAAKAAVAGTTETFWLGANPGTLFADGVAKVGQTSVSWEAGKPVVTFPIPGVPGATATATLDAKYMTERVVVTQGSTTTEFTYSDYQGLEQPAEQDRSVLRRQDGRAPERRGRPRPDDGRDGDGQRVCGCARAGKRAEGDQGHGADSHAACSPRRNLPVDKSAPTPRLGAHPDLTGNWAYTDWIGNYMTGGGRRCGPTQETDCNRSDQSDRRFRALLALAVRPIESSRVQAGALGQGSGARHVDEQVRPGHDLPAAGSPAAGPTPAHLPVGERRDLPLFGRRCRRRIRRVSHHPDRWPQAQRKTRSSISRTWGIPWDAGRATRSCSTPSRSSIRHGWGAAVSSTPIEMHVVEKFTRQGDVILYDVTVEDPEVLVEPWVLPTRTVRRNTNPNAGLLRERGNCETSFETEAAATQIRH